MTRAVARLTFALAAFSVLVLPGCHVEEAPRAQPRLGKSIAIGARPVAIQVADRFVWVTTDEGRLLRIDPRTARRSGPEVDLGRPSPTREIPIAVVGEHIVWIVRPGGSVRSHCFVQRLDLRSGRRSTPLRIGGAARAASQANGTLWLVTDEHAVESVQDGVVRDREVSRLVRVTGDDRFSATVVLTEDGSTSPLSDVEAEPGAVWALGIDGTITRIDPRSGRRKVRPGAGLGTSIAAGAGTVWVLRNDGRATQVDRRSLRARPTIVFRGYTQDLVAEGESAWVLLQLNRGVLRLHSNTNSIGDRIETGPTHSSARMAVGEGALWLTDPREESVVRIPIG